LLLLRVAELRAGIVGLRHRRCVGRVRRLERQRRRLARLDQRAHGLDELRSVRILGLDLGERRRGGERGGLRFVGGTCMRRLGAGEPGLCRARGDGRELQLLDRPVDLDELAHLVLHQALGFLGERIDPPLDELRQRVLEPGGQATDGFFFHGISLFLERCQPALEKKARVSGPSQRRSRACFLLKT
jgi:hypothetical protein